MCARQVDSYLMGTGSSLPVTGGIIRRPQHDTVPVPKMSKHAANGDLARATEEFKRTTDIEVNA